VTGPHPRRSSVVVIEAGRRGLARNALDGTIEFNRPAILSP
jgi:hypothetical protein